MDIGAVAMLVGAAGALASSLTVAVLKVVIPALGKRKSHPPPQAAETLGSPLAAAQAQAEVLSAIAALTLVLAKIEAQHAETEAALERLANAIAKQTEVLYRKIEIAVETNLETKALSRRLDSLHTDTARIVEIIDRAKGAHQ